MKKFDESEGVWRTIGGRRVFIRKGQGLSDAMKESGKFKARMNEKAVKGAREEDLKEQYMTSLNNVSKLEYDGEITKDDYDEAIKNINKAYKERKLNKGQDKFYVKKDGTKEYDPYKGTRFEKKYDSAEEALNDPNHPTRKYIDENLKVPRASGAKDFSEYGIRIEDENVKTRFSDYLRDKYGTDDFRIISYDDSKKAQNIYSDFNKQELKKYQEYWLNNDEYLQANNPSYYFQKMINESNKKDFKINKDVVKEQYLNPNNLIKDNLVRKDEGKNKGNNFYVANITPDEYLNLTTTPELYNKIINDNKTTNFELDTNKLNNSYMYLTVDPATGKVVGHNGRHRMLELKKAGYTNADILVFDSTGKNADKEILNKQLINQFDDEGYKTTINKMTKVDDNYFGGDLKQTKVFKTNEANPLEDYAKDSARQKANAEANERAYKKDKYNDLLPKKYKGTIEYLQQTTNMTISEIYELLKKIEQDKK